MNKAFMTLELPDTSTPEEVRKKWRKLCMIHHPDRGGNPVVFNTIHRAYIQAYKEASQPKTCPQCLGTGKIIQTSGFNSIQLSCPSCEGTGFTIK